MSCDRSVKAVDSHQPPVTMATVRQFVVTSPRQAWEMNTLLKAQFPCTSTCTISVRRQVTEVRTLSCSLLGSWLRVGLELGAAE